MTIKLHAVPCTGEAHSNPFIDSCGQCAPLWGHVVRNQDPKGREPTRAEIIRFAKYRDRAMRVMDAEQEPHSLHRMRLALALAAEFFR